MAASSPNYVDWVTAPKLEGLEASLGDPSSVRQFRAEALRAFLELAVEPNPTYRGYSNFGTPDLSTVDPTEVGPPVGVPPSDLSTVRVVHDASGTRVELPRVLEAAGVRVTTLPALWKEDGAGLGPITSTRAEDRLHALALALVNRAVRIEVPDRCPVPVRVQDLTIFSRSHEALSVHRTIRAGARSRVLVSEEVYSTSEPRPGDHRLYGSLVELAGGEDSALHYLTVHAPDSQAASVYQRHASVGGHGRLAWVWAGFGGLHTRMKNLSELPGNGSSIDDLQTFYGHGDQSYDSAVQITHIGTDTHGQSITRGLFKDRSRGVSRGLVRIEKEARKTLSYLSEHAMLLSRGARSDTIPVLEILCRDVKATHSSSVAPVDPEKVFYLSSRGLTDGEAVRMIGEGFLSHVLERAPVQNLRDLLYPILADRWDDRPVLWGPERFPALPALNVADDAASEDWRFDAKLR
jgi:Fe-S cluster assembly scaffold protein SufB